MTADTVTAASTPRSSTELLSRVHLTAADRCRAEAALLRGEALADALLALAQAVRALFEHQPRHAANPHDLKSAN